jgi:hypothetical protein
MDFFANDVIQKMVMTGKKYEVDKVLKEIPKTAIPNKVYRNDRNLRFTDIGKDWGLAQPSFSNGSAYGDLDNDGDLDLVVNNENQPCFVYRNNARELNSNNYISVILSGTQQNTFAVGSKLKLYMGNEILTREQVPSRGFQSSVDYKLVFGLGKNTKVDSILITWPDRTTSKIDHPQINSVLHLKQKQLQTTPRTLVHEKAGEIIFSKVAANFERHQENDYVDFYNEPNIPRIFSREGPKIATADVNGDGLTDVYIGGAQGKIGQLYLQTAACTFTKKDENAFKPFSDFEDVAVLFFDYDNDGDADLLICPGGNNHSLNSREWQLRLFTNDGKGNFELNSTAFPNMSMNIAVAIANDFNNDGFPDLYIGARSYPGVYGKDPQSYLFVNDGKGHFNDIAQTKNPDIAFAGMITGATWADIVGDKQKELVIAGEWMAPRIFAFNGNKFDEVKTNIGDKSGWWQSIAVADVNNDGRQDLILGNIGENFYLKPSSAKPIKLWLNDFDANGDADKIITYTIDGKDMPVILKRDLQDQLPALKKNNLKHSEYATKAVQDLFPKAMIASSVVKQFNYASSSVAINNGGGYFTVKPLPFMSQLSCINSIQPLDINEDGFIDLVSGGNQFGFTPQFEKLDGSFGDVLINDGKGNFIWQDAKRTGLDIGGELRDIATIKTSRGTFLLFTQNNDYPLLYKLN